MLACSEVKAILGERKECSLCPLTADVERDGVVFCWSCYCDQYGTDYDLWNELIRRWTT